MINPQLNLDELGMPGHALGHLLGSKRALTLPPASK